MCTHLKPVEDYLKQSGFTEIYRGKTWSDNCREWIYLNEIIDPSALKEKFHLDNTIVIHNYQNIKVGSEYGLVCTICKDAIIGRHPDTIGTI